MSEREQLTNEELDEGLASIRMSPRDEGALIMIVVRPAIGLRETPDSGELSEAEGLVGDCWSRRDSTRTADGSPHPDMQLTLINARLIALIAREKEQWPLAGDQLVVDLDIGVENIPVGTRLALGSAIVEITDQPHTGCSKFSARFGSEALKWVNSPVGRELRLRGVYAKVVKPGSLRVGEIVTKVQTTMSDRRGLDG